MTTQIASTLSRVSIERRTRVAELRLNNPPLNVIDVAMIEQLSRQLAALEADPGLSVITVSLKKKSFSAGVDVAAHSPEQVEEMLVTFHGVIRALIRSQKVTIAVIRGSCLGGAAEMALACDMAYTAESATWGFPEIKLACYPPVAATALAFLVGQKRAADLILTGRTISGREAAEMGLANRAVPPPQLERSVAECLDRLTQLSSAALAMAKKAIFPWDSMHFDKGLARAEKIYLEELRK
ncbi:MAG: enoyl-CoA hydratase/isomerase family protein, partial [Acidobacteria bacterium]|nr:enoyl-CoA hydratase/isomerase family protein [Acidobacteriota bacterium]